MDVEIPEEAHLYYISFRTYSEDLRTHTLSTPYGNSNGYRGYLYSSTDVVVLGDGGIIAEE